MLLICLTLEEWKVESTLKLSSDFERRTKIGNPVRQPLGYC